VAVDVRRFNPNGPKFAALDLLASFEFKTATSVGFHLGHSRPHGFFVVGLLEVHHPCEGHVKARLTVVLPEEYHPWERMRDLVQQVFTELSIPADETYEAHFVAPGRQSALFQHTDRNGITDVFFA
jgi:hypothetical protein